MPRLPADPAASPRPLVDAEWSRDWGCWVVSSLFRGQWTLVGLFRDSGPAFRAASRAANELGDEPAEREIEAG